MIGADYLLLANGWHAKHKATPQLMGQLFHLFESPNRFGLAAFYTLHVWAWKDNPTGMFVNWHTNVSCDAFRRTEPLSVCVLFHRPPSTDRGSTSPHQRNACRQQMTKLSRRPSVSTQPEWHQGRRPAGAAAGWAAAAPSQAWKRPTRGYSRRSATMRLEGVDLGLGCGRSSTIAGLREGERVLDLGSGAG